MKKVIAPSDRLTSMRVLPMTDSSPLVPIAITTGDPAGVGPEVVVRALASKELAGKVLPIIVGSIQTLERAARLTGVDIELVPLDEEDSPFSAPLAPAIRARVGSSGTGLARSARFETGKTKAACTNLGFLNVGGKRRPIFVVTPAGMPRGLSVRARGQISFACVREAVRLCSEGVASGVVTAPISKASLGAAGLRFVGHTEMLRSLCGCKRTVMMFVCDELRISLVTTHTPIGLLARRLDKSGVGEVIALTKKSLTMLFGIAKPKLSVLALNPHAGEAGLLGSEENRIITPAVLSAKRRGVLVEGPFPADSFFSQGRWKDFHATIAMYHDQALIPVKLIGGDRVVNLTLGLPFVRTSPGHGTAEDVAWQGRARAEGMISAILLAADLAKKVRLPLRWD